MAPVAPRARDPGGMLACLPATIPPMRNICTRLAVVAGTAAAVTAQLSQFTAITNSAVAHEDAKICTDELHVAFRTGTASLTIPFNPALRGLKLWVQALELDQTFTGSFTHLGYFRVF
jgi:hypothetical protein